MSPSRKAAYTSFAYNVGIEAFCRSSVAWKFNGGDSVGSCDALLLYVKAKGITLPGLVKRREQERELCLA
jgi:lysozyme